MHHQIVNEILYDLRTIELFEDTYGLNDGSDIDDPDYAGYNPQLDAFLNEPEGPSTAPLILNFNGNTPMGAPLPKCFYRTPRDGFLNNDPYMYYESSEYPTDEDYFRALFNLKSNDELIRSDDLYSSLYFDPLHQYIVTKSFYIDFKPPRKEWKSIISFYDEIKDSFVNVMHEYDRINDLQDFADGMW